MDQSPITVVTGPRGRGKTHWVRGSLDSEPRILILDAMGEYDYPPLWSLSDLVAWYDRGGPTAPRWRFSIRTPGEDADEVFRAVWSFAPLHLVVEEADRYRSGIMPLPGLSYLIEYGRHAEGGGISLTLCSRRPAAIPRTVTANASRAIVFFTPEPADQKYWREFLPQDAGGHLAELRGHQHIDADLWAGSYEIRG